MNILGTIVFLSSISTGASNCNDCGLSELETASHEDLLMKTFLTEDDPVWHRSTVKKNRYKGGFTNIAYVAFRPYFASENYCRTTILEYVVGDEVCENDRCKNAEVAAFQIKAYPSFYQIKDGGGEMECQNSSFENYVKVNKNISNKNFDFLMSSFDLTYPKWLSQKDNNKGCDYSKLSKQDIDFLDIDLLNKVVIYNMDSPCHDLVTLQFNIYFDNDVITAYKLNELLP